MYMYMYMGVCARISYLSLNSQAHTGTDNRWSLLCHHWLSLVLKPLSGGVYSIINVPPSSLPPSLFLSTETRPFVLTLWQFLHTCQLQKTHQLADRELEDLTPLPLLSRETLDREDSREGQLLVKRIQVRTGLLFKRIRLLIEAHALL